MGIKENAFAYIDAHRSEMLKMWEELDAENVGRTGQHRQRL